MARARDYGCRLQLLGQQLAYCADNGFASLASWTISLHHPRFGAWISAESKFDLRRRAALSGHLPTLQAFMGGTFGWQSYPSDPELCLIAARKGDLEMLRWLRAQCISWYTPEDPAAGSLMTAACANGHLNVAVWAAENGYQWGVPSRFRADTLTSRLGLRAVNDWIKADPTYAEKYATLAVAQACTCYRCTGGQGFGVLAPLFSRHSNAGGWLVRGRFSNRAPP